MEKQAGRREQSEEEDDDPGFRAGQQSRDMTEAEQRTGGNELL